MNDSLAPLSSARWRRLIPIAFITYSFAYVDRSNYSIGAAGGLVDKLHITSGQSGCWAACSSLATSCSRCPRVPSPSGAASPDPGREAVYVPLPREPQLDAG